MRDQRTLPLPPVWPRVAVVGGFLLGLLLVLAVRANADEDTAPDFRPPPAGVPPLMVGVVHRFDTQAGNAIATGSQGPMAVLPTLFLPPGTPLLPDAIQDDKGLPELPANLDPSDPKKLLEVEKQFYEYKAYLDALTKAYEFKAPQFAASVGKDYPRYQLLKQPKRHRGVVVHLEGNLRRLRRYDAPLMAQANNIDHVYEGWVFEDESSDPWCVVFPELPAAVAGQPALEPGERLNQPVAFDGYFFKAYGYTNQQKDAQVAPLLIGNSPVLKGPPVDGAGPAPAMLAWSPILLYGVFGVVLLVGLILGGLTWWFRRSDAQVRDKLTAIAHKQFVDPSDEGFPN